MAAADDQQSGRLGREDRQSEGRGEERRGGHGGREGGGRGEGREMEGRGGERSIVCEWNTVNSWRPTRKGMLMKELVSLRSKLYTAR